MKDNSAYIQAWSYKKFSELSPAAAIKALEADRLFSSKVGVKKTNFLKDPNLYKEDGSLAGMTVSERRRWFT